MKWLKWIDNNILKILLGLYVFFIPLFPKFPFQFVTYTYISVRLDDFFVAFIAAIFFLQIIRRKIKLKDLPFLKIFIAFWIVVFLSMLSSFYLTKTVDYHFVGFLNTARRVQYMVFFFIAYASIKSVRDFTFLLYSLIASNFLVIMYGLGQRFFDFPAVSTMNPEFAKGRILFLTPEARLSSTFAGHYDLAAFLVFLFPILWGVYFYISNKKKISITNNERIIVLISALAPFILTAYLFTKSVYQGNLVQTMLVAAQAPFNQIIVITMAIAILAFILFFDVFQRATLFVVNLISILIIVFTASRTSSIAYIISTSAFLAYFRKFKHLVLIVILSLGLTFADKDLFQRWFSTLQIKQIILNEKTGQQAVVQRIQSDKLPAGTSFVKLRDSRDTLESSKLKLDLANKATMSGQLASAEAYETVTAVAADISIATRFEASWPRAIRAFLQNPLLGTGPASITESSDGDYFRWLGETGGIGFALFVAILGLIAKEIFQLRHKVQNNSKMLVVGFIFGLFGLMINALLIDIFEASKLAYIFWLSAGIFIGLLHLDKKELEKL